MTHVSNLSIDCGYQPGAIGRIAELHGTYYADHWDFGLYFEAKVANELSEFLLRYDEKKDGIWLARRDGRIEGGIVIDGQRAASGGATCAGSSSLMHYGEWAWAGPSYGPLWHSAPGWNTRRSIYGRSRVSRRLAISTKRSDSV